MQQAPVPALDDFLTEFQVILWNPDLKRFEYSGREELYNYFLSRMAADGYITGYTPPEPEPAPDDEIV